MLSIGCIVPKKVVFLDAARRVEPVHSTWYSFRVLFHLHCKRQCTDLRNAEYVRMSERHMLEGALSVEVSLSYQSDLSYNPTTVREGPPRVVFYRPIHRPYAIWHAHSIELTRHPLKSCCLMVNCIRGRIFGRSAGRSRCSAWKHTRIKSLQR